MRFLPKILSRFAQAYPLVQVEVHCEPSGQLLLRQDLDLTIVTRQPGKEIGQLVVPRVGPKLGGPSFLLWAPPPRRGGCCLCV